MWLIRRMTGSARASWLVFLAAFLTVESSKREEPQLRYKIQEELPRGTLVSNLIEDARLSYSADILHLLRFRFLTDSNAMFDISPATGIITTAVIIDRDSSSLCRQKELCEVSLDVVIQPSEHFQILKIIVEILDINDNSPKFRESRITLPINEAAAVGSAYIIPTANDIDSPANGVQRYELDSVSDRFGLQINPKLDRTLEVKLVLKEKLDREMESEYQLKLVAYDAGGPTAKTGTLIIDVVIHDSNDNKPEFMEQQYELSIKENLPIGSTILQVLAIDQDAGPNGLVGYSFAMQTQGLHGHLFAIRNLTGEIIVKGVVDHEKASVYQLVVIAQDHGPDMLSSEVTVIVHVEDLNDNSPQVTFHTLSSSGSPVAEIPEDSAVGTFVAHISVLDPDSGMNGRVNCSINEKIFSLVQKYSTEYQIVTATTLDRERTEQYVVTVRCQDAAIVPRTTEKTLRVIISDVNDNPPVFVQQTYTGSLTENNYVGSSVLQVTASDWDEGENAKIQYSLPGDVASIFHIDQRGVISAHKSIDREMYDIFRFSVIAVDMGVSPKTGSAMIIIEIEDENDEKPRFTQPSFIFSVFENEPPNTKVGTLLAKDKDSPPYNNFMFSFVSDNSVADIFMIDAASGIIKTRKILDRETVGLYKFLVMVYDPNKSAMTDTASVSVQVLDRNDNAPEFIFPNSFNNTVYISTFLPTGHVVTPVLASDIDLEENSKISYKIVDNRNNNGTFKVNSNTVVVATRLPVIEFRVYQVTVQATDHGSPPKSISAILYIHVNQSIPFKGYVNGGEKEEVVQSTYNLMIVIGIASGCLIVVFLLIIAIIVVRQKDKRRHIRKYNCRMEALRMLTTKEMPVSSSSPESSPKKKMPNGNKHFMSLEDRTTECSAMMTVVSQVAADDVGQQPSNDSNQQAISKPWHSNKDVESHTWVHNKPAIGGDVDKDSVHSVEGSITDSGRGPSEEGEAGHSKHNRERYLPPPPPPPRGAYWLQQKSSSGMAQSHPTVRFQGLSSTPEEVAETSENTRQPSAYQDKTFSRPASQLPYSSNSFAIQGPFSKTTTLQPYDSHLTQQRNVASRFPGQQATLDQLSRQRTTLDQLPKLDSVDQFIRQPALTAYDQVFVTSKSDCANSSQPDLDKGAVIIGRDVIV